jgi:hypothetical protein
LLICRLLHVKHCFADKKIFPAVFGMPLLAPDLDTGHEDIGAHTARVGKVHRQEAEDGRNKDADQPVQKNHNVGGMPLLAPDPDSGHGDVGAHAARVEEVHRQGAEDGQEEDADQPVEKTHDAGVTTGVKKERRRRKRREGDDS